MGEDPNVIREQIEQTRERMGETVDALSYKADVPARAKDAVHDRVDTLKSKLTGVSHSISDAAPDADDVKSGARQAAGLAQENPLGLAVGAAAVGFLAGLLIPATNVENERLGPIADEVKHQARQTGQEAVEHGKQLVDETAQIAIGKVEEVATEIGHAAEERSREHGEQLAKSAKQSAEENKETTQSVS